MTDQPTVDTILEVLKGSIDDPPSEIWEHFRQLLRQGISAEEGHRVIKAALEMPPPDRWKTDRGGTLIHMMSESGRFTGEHGVTIIPLLLELYPSFREGPRRYAMQLLMHVPESQGAEAVMSLFRKFGRTGEIPQYSIHKHRLQPLHANIYFPEMLDYAPLDGSGHAFDIWYLCLAFCRTKRMEITQIASRAGLIAQAYRTLREIVLHERANNTWKENDAYWVALSAFGVLLDLMQFLRSAEIIQLVREDLTRYEEAELSLWICATGLKLGIPVEAEVIQRVCAMDAVRNEFYEQLLGMERTDLFPEEYFNIRAFARSELADWLADPNQLGWPPLAIELTHIIEESTDKGVMEWYLFRYLALEAEDSGIWWAGWCSVPQNIAVDLFWFNDVADSRFKPWDSKRPEEHLGLKPESVITVIDCRT